MLGKLRSMSADEVRVRATQEMNKHLDAYRTRWLPASILPRVPDAALGETAFLRSPEQIASSIEYLCSAMPQTVATSIARAERIRGGRFDLLGYADLDFGRSPDWHLDPVSGRRLPLVPWCRLERADLAPLDRKVVWELNRHQYLAELARAYRYSGDADHLATLQAHWYSWRDANPYPLGVNWSSALEVAFRSLSWLWVDMLLAGDHRVTDDFRGDLRRLQALNLRHLSRYLSTYSGPNTHLLGELVAIYYLGASYPALPGADDWVGESLRRIVAECDRQVRDDGFYFEQSTHYHVYALDFLIHTLVLARHRDDEEAGAIEAVVRKMLEALAAISQAGQPFRIGDDDGGRVLLAWRNRNEHMTDPLAFGAAWFDDAGYAGLAGGPSEECAWLLAPHRLAVLGANASVPAMLSRYLDDGGLVVSTSEAGGRWQLGIDAGPQGTGNSGHGHADALSVQLSGNDRQWLVDPGTGNYADVAVRDRLRATTAHNTLTIDGASQARRGHAFAWHDLPSVHVTAWHATPDWDFFSGWHTGFERLDPAVVHARSVLRLGNCWIVRDRALAGGSAGADAEIRWHVAPDVELDRRGDGQFCLRAAGDSVCLVVAGPGVSSRCETVEYSPAYGVLEKTSALVVAADAPAEFFSVIAPGDSVPALDVRRSDAATEVVLGLGGERLRVAYHDAAATSDGCYRAECLRAYRRVDDAETVFIDTESLA